MRFFRFYKRLYTMVGDSKINTQVDLKSYVEDSSINDSVFISSSISLDVVIGIGVIFAIILSILLFFRNAKKIKLLERETVIILKLLRKHNNLHPDSQV